MQLLRVLWLALVAAALLTFMTFTTVIADGSTGILPDWETDSTDSTGGLPVPDTLSVIEATQGSSATTIYLELWGLLF